MEQIDAPPGRAAGSGRDLALDGVRCVAVTLVFLSHYGDVEWGWTGVQIFFVLSGFLITRVLLAGRAAPHRLRRFYGRRVRRLLPLLVALACAVTLLAAPLHLALAPSDLLWIAFVGNGVRFVTGDFATEMISSTNGAHVFWLGHLWSLAVEEQFYLVWPFVVYAASERRALLCCGVVIVLAPIARLCALALLPHAMLALEWNYRITVMQADAFLWGAAGALALRLGEPARVRRVATIVGASAAVGIALATAAHVRWTPADPTVQTLGLTLADAASAAIVVSCVAGNGLATRLLSWAPARRIGRVSYGFYVLHGLLLPLLSRGFAVVERPAWAAFSYALVLALALLSSRYVEEPFLRRRVSRAPTAA